MAQQMSQQDEALNEVNVIPLADLSLVLLIILMVMSPMVSQAIIQVAAAKAAAAQTREELPDPQAETPLIVSFSPGMLKINGTRMGSDMEFVRRLDGIMQKRRDKSVILTASPDLIHGKVVKLMDILKRHGAENLILVKWDPSAPANQTASGDRS